MAFSSARAAVLGFGTTLALGAGAAVAADGKAVYETRCAVCHAAGVANAPKISDKAAWAPRLPAGVGALTGSVVKGKGAMPPRAGVPDLKDIEIKAAVEFIVSVVR